MCSYKILAQSGFCACHHAVSDTQRISQFPNHSHAFTRGDEEEGKHAEADDSPVEPLVQSECETDREECGQTMGTRKGASTGVVRLRCRRKPGQRRYIWCPIKGCLSGPIKKLTQHLYRVHNLPPSTVAQLNTPESRRGMYALLDAMEKRTPCPAQKQRTLEPNSNVPTMASSPSTSQGPTSPHTKGKVREGSRGKGKGKAPPESYTRAPRRRVSSTRHMMYHRSDPFLSNFLAYLRSWPGGKRSEAVKAPLCKDVAKYLFFLGKESVRPELLLMKRPLVDYLRVVEEEYGVGCSGLLHKLEYFNTRN